MSVFLIFFLLFLICACGLRKHFHRKVEPSGALPVSMNCEVLPTGQVLSSFNYLNRSERDALLVYHTDFHAYSLGESLLTYLDERIEHLFPPFNEEQQARRIAQKRGEEMVRVKESWASENEQACKVGRFVHRQIANFLLGKKVQMSFQYKYRGTTISVSRLISIIPEMNQFTQYWNEQGLKPYRTEWVIYDEDNKLVGTVDLLAQDANGDYILVDWTRSHTLGHELGTDYTVYSGFNHYLIPTPLQQITDAPFMKYCLHLNFLRMILQRHYGLTVKKMNLLVLHADNQTFHSLEVPFMEDEIRYIINHTTPLERVSK